MLSSHGEGERRDGRAAGLRHRHGQERRQLARVNPVALDNAPEGRAGARPSRLVRWKQMKTAMFFDDQAGTFSLRFGEPL